VTTRAEHPRGQILIIVAGGLVILLLAVGLVIDTGLSFVVRRDAQNVADLASLAGTKVVADHYVDGGRTGAEVFTAVDANATAIGCVDTCSWSAEYVAAPPVVGGVEPVLGDVVNGGAIPATAQGVKVSVEKPSPTQFMRIIGLDEVPVSTSGVALTADPPTIGPGVLLPIAMSPEVAMVPGEVYNLTDGKDGPGNFGWLSWTDDNAAGVLADSICTPDNPEITVPTYIPGAPGKKNKGDLRGCLDEYIADGTTVLVPIWDGTHPGNGENAEYRIVGFAAFVLTYTSQPAVDNIQGAFVEYFPLTTVPAGFSPPSAGSVTYFLGLVR
jgi:Flp pilus assembly protein TadG